ncbi:MAG TPA: hypothetical protein VEI25_06290, partial [Paraburkholderia sp.]|nr:hypothetical protein [Paraburkholderia sp.]
MGWNFRAEFSAIRDRPVDGLFRGISVAQALTLLAPRVPRRAAIRGNMIDVPDLFHIFAMNLPGSSS